MVRSRTASPPPIPPGLPHPGSRISVAWSTGWFDGVVAKHTVELDGKSIVAYTAIDYDDGTTSAHILEDLEFKLLDGAPDKSPLAAPSNDACDECDDDDAATTQREKPMPDHDARTSVTPTDGWLGHTPGKKLRTAHIGDRHQAELPGPPSFAAPPPALPPLCQCVEPSVWHGERWYCAKRVQHQLQHPPPPPASRKQRASRSGRLASSGSAPVVTMGPGCSSEVPECLEAEFAEGSGQRAAIRKVAAVAREGELLVTSAEASKAAAVATAAMLTASAYSIESARALGGWHFDYFRELPKESGRAPTNRKGAICTTPGCSLPEYHTGLCTSHSVAGQRQRRPSVKKGGGRADVYVFDDWAVNP